MIRFSMQAGSRNEVKEEAKQYVADKNVPQLFESLTAGLLHHQPGDPLQFVQECLANMKDSPELVRWNSFIDYKPSERAMSGKRRGSPVESSGTASAANDPTQEPSKNDIENSLNKGYTQYTKTPDSQT